VDAAVDGVAVDDDSGVVAGKWLTACCSQITVTTNGHELIATKAVCNV